MRITAQQLTAIVPMIKAGTAAAVVAALNNIAIPQAELITTSRLAAFLAQMLHETGGFKWMRELGGEEYFTRYDGRFGNTQPGDGYRYRGRGWVMLTFRANYTAAAEELSLDLINNPDLAATHHASARIAAWYWMDRNINAAADAGDFRRVTKLINGGYNGLKGRISYYERCKMILNHGDSDNEEMS